MAERLWIPADYVDEVTPPGRPHPDNWIGPPAGDVWMLAPSEEDGEPDVRLVPGQIVEFTWVEDLGSVEVELHADGTHTIHGAVPIEATHFWLQFDPDTLADSMDAFVRFWRENDVSTGIEERLDVRMARWAETDERFRFDVTERGPRFIRPAPARDGAP